MRKQSGFVHRSIAPSTRLFCSISRPLSTSKSTSKHLIQPKDLLLLVSPAAAVVAAAAVAGTARPSAGTHTHSGGAGADDAAAADAAEAAVQAEAVVEHSLVAPAHTHPAAHILAVRTLADRVRLAAAGHSSAEAVRTVRTAPAAPGPGVERRIEPSAVLVVTIQARMHWGHIARIRSDVAVVGAPAAAAADRGS